MIHILYLFNKNYDLLKLWISINQGQSNEIAVAMTEFVVVQYYTIVAFRLEGDFDVELEIRIGKRRESDVALRRLAEIRNNTCYNQHRGHFDVGVSIIRNANICPGVLGFYVG